MEEYTTRIRISLFSPEETRYLDDDFNAQFSYLILDTFGILDPKDLMARCIPIHHKLQTVLKEKWGFYHILRLVLLR